MYAPRQQQYLSAKNPDDSDAKQTLRTSTIGVRSRELLAEFMKTMNSLMPLQNMRRNKSTLPVARNHEAI
jgi:hypothetical protein